MSQNRAGLTFEALIHENKKRPNNRLQKLLEQKLFILNSMKNESDRLYRKERRDLITRQRIYDRILGSLTHTYSTAESRKETRMSEMLNTEWDPLNVQGLLREQGLYGKQGSDAELVELAPTTPKLDRKRLNTKGAFGVKATSSAFGVKSEEVNEEVDEEGEEGEEGEEVKEVPVKKRTWKDALKEIKERSMLKQVQIDAEPSEIPEKTFTSETSSLKTSETFTLPPLREEVSPSPSVKLPAMKSGLSKLERDQAKIAQWWQQRALVRCAPEHHAQE